MKAEAPEEFTYDLALLDRSYAKWKSSPSLRWIYGQFYQRAKAHAKGARILELGSGIGRIKDFWPTVTTSDLIKTEYVDCAVSAYEISESGHWDTIFALDVLHHLRAPLKFFESVSRALRPGGRLVLIEPSATIGGKLLYRLFHHEPCLPELIQPPFEFAPNESGGGFANMGMGVGLFRNFRSEVDGTLQKIGLRVVDESYHECLAYFVTGGYSRNALAPMWVIQSLHKIEAMFPQVIAQFLCNRMTVVLESS
ncbi:MAG: class I SAM-dependent methyltransferase [Opitutales bacterium]